MTSAESPTHTEITALFDPLLKVIPFNKIVDLPDGRHSVEGIFTSESPDRDGEICVYSDTAPNYKAWSADAFKSTSTSGAEPSYGNVRIQHTMEVGGKVTRLDFDDQNRVISGATEPIDDSIWNKIKRGFFKGYSHAGKYLYRHCAECGGDIEKGTNCPKCHKKVLVKYAARISEVSYVDAPCLSDAVFTHIKADGSSALYKFSKNGGMEEARAITKAVTARVSKVQHTQDLEKDKGITFTVGFPKDGGGSEVQSVIFSRDHWDRDKAVNWLKSHEFSGHEVDETGNSLRFRQNDPGQYERIRTIKPGSSTDSTGNDTGSDNSDSADKAEHDVIHHQYLLAHGNRSTFKTVREVFDYAKPAILSKLFLDVEEFVEYATNLFKDDAFESKHPRGDSGRFAGSEGGGKGKDRDQGEEKGEGKDQGKETQPKDERIPRRATGKRDLPFDGYIASETKDKGSQHKQPEEAKPVTRGKERKLRGRPLPEPKDEEVVQPPKTKRARPFDLKQIEAWESRFARKPGEKVPDYKPDTSDPKSTPKKSLLSFLTKAINNTKL